MPLPAFMLRQPIHLAPGRHADLVGPSVVSEHRADGVAAVAVVVARHRRVGATGAAGGVNAVVPVVVVVGRGAVPAPVLGPEHVVGPADAGVHAAHDDVLAREAQGPDLRGLDVGDAGLDGGGGLRAGRLGRRQDHPHARVAVDAGHVGALGHGVGQRPVALHPDQVDDVVRAVLHAPGLQVGQDRRLGLLGLLVERLVDEAPLVQLGLERVCARQVGLVGQHQGVLGQRAGLGAFEHPRRDLGQGRGGRRGERRQAQPAQQAQDDATKGHGSSLLEKSQPRRIAGLPPGRKQRQRLTEGAMRRPRGPRPRRSPRRSPSTKPTASSPG